MAVRANIIISDVILTDMDKHRLAEHPLHSKGHAAPLLTLYSSDSSFRWEILRENCVEFRKKKEMPWRIVSQTGGCACAYLEP